MSDMETICVVITLPESTGLCHAKAELDRRNEDGEFIFSEITIGKLRTGWSAVTQTGKDGKTKLLWHDRRTGGAIGRSNIPQDVHEIVSTGLLCFITGYQYGLEDAAPKPPSKAEIKGEKEFFERNHAKRMLSPKGGRS